MVCFIFILLLLGDNLFVSIFNREDFLFLFVLIILI